MMPTDEDSLSALETAALLYLIAPMLVFFAAFVRIEAAVPACALIALLIYRMLRRTMWQRADDLWRWESLYLFVLAVVWLCWLDGIGPLKTNGGWFKHYAVLNFLVTHSWPPETHLVGADGFSLRYYLGWYLIPSLVLKFTDFALQQYALLTWSIAGLYLLLRLMAEGARKIWMVLVLPLAFATFGGADFFGNLLLRHEADPLQFVEWWAGWIQYSSITNALAWVPQHVIPAWLGARLLMRATDRRGLSRFCLPLLCAVSLWSPFSAVGLLPFALALTLKSSSRSGVLEWPGMLSVLVLAVPIGLYFASGSSDVPHGFIWNLPCTTTLPCFSWPGYVLFIFFEIGAPLAILFLMVEEPHPFLKVAAITLCVIPLYKVGINNDFGMRASLPAIAILAMFCARALATAKRRAALSMLAVLVAAMPQLYFALATPIVDPIDAGADARFAEDFRVRTDFLTQYFAPSPVWILR